jgi:RNA polymerase sigma-70 factor (ECF subfamily)
VYSEKELIKGCQRGNARCEEALYKRYGARMMGVCARYGRTRFEAEDIFQEAFMKVFQHIGTYQGGSLEGWMKRIFVNTAINHYHRYKHQYGEVEYDQADEAQAGNDDPLDALSTEELLKLINHLPEGYRLVFNLFVIEGYSHKEVGALLGISEGTSKSQLSKAKGLLQRQLIHLYPSAYAERPRI